MHSAFNQFAAFQQDASDNKAFVAKGKLTMPVLAIGADESFGTVQAEDLRFVATNVYRARYPGFWTFATNVTALVIPDSGHWLIEEQPAATIAAVRTFLEK
jgi:pimeloyl-ACP methyl ester carboxylesterase